MVLQRRLKLIGNFCSINDLEAEIKSHVGDLEAEKEPLGTG